MLLASPRLSSHVVVSLMRRISLRPADPSSVRGELELKAEVKKAAAEREGELKRRRDVAIEQAPALGLGVRDEGALWLGLARTRVRLRARVKVRAGVRGRARSTSCVGPAAHHGSLPQAQHLSGWATYPPATYGVSVSVRVRHRVRVRVRVRDGHGEVPTVPAMLEQELGLE